MGVTIEFNADAEAQIQRLAVEEAFARALMVVGIWESTVPGRGPFSTAKGSTSVMPTATGARGILGDPYWHLIEYGTAGSPAHGGLAKGFAAARLVLHGGIR
jgi:hypothetical protein